MHPPQELLKYIQLCRSHGLPDSKIRDKLLARGWREQLVRIAMYEALPRAPREKAPFSDVIHRPATFAEPQLKHAQSAEGAATTEEATHTIENFLAHEHVRAVFEEPATTAGSARNFARVTTGAAAPPKTKKGLKSWQGYALACLVLLLGMAGLSAYVFPHEAPRATAETAPHPITVNDQNYTLVLPQGWQKSSDYSSGSGVNVFYQNTDSSNTGGRMTIFVVPKSSTPAPNHTDTQIAGLKQNGATASITQQSVVQLGTASGTLTQVKAAAASNPNSITYYMYLAVTYGDTLYNVDAAIPSGQWQQSHEAVLNSLKSFRPASTSITHRQVTAKTTR